VAVALLSVLLLSSCGDGDGDGGNGGTGAGSPTAGSDDDGGGGGGNGGGIAGPCDLTEPSVVAEVFGGTVAAEKPGVVRSCEYAVQGGAAEMVMVYYYGTADQWSGIRGGYEDNRGPLADVAGVGDEAFHPADAGPLEIVVRAGEVSFAVGLGLGDATGDAAAKVKELATRIAGSVS
jgi:hypothetical protein